MQAEINVSNSIAEIVLNRPDKLNAMGELMVGDIHSHLETAEAAGVRALIFRGEGRAFSAVGVPTLPITANTLCLSNSVSILARARSGS